MKLVLLESPYAGEVARNIAYARACMRDSLSQGEAPFAMHLLYTQEGILDDLCPQERDKGITAGLLWGRNAEATVVYVDFGISSGMKLGIDDAQKHNRPVIYRKLSVSAVSLLSGH